MDKKTFSGKDQYDLDQQIWNWRSANPHIKVVKTHPVENIELRMTSPTPNFGLIKPPQDTVSVTIDYEKSN